MSAAFKFGTPIFYDTIKKELEFQDITSESAIRSEMSERALKSINANDGSGGGAQNQAILRANGMKEEYGNGVCTRILIYNASGIPLTCYETHDSSGHWSKYGPPSRIEVGEWGVCFHVKTSGSATGSCGIVSFHLEGEPYVFTVSWDVPWSGSNNASCYTMTKEGYEGTSWEKAHQWAEEGPAIGGETDCGFKVEYSIDQDSSPILIVQISKA
jgi:hypothetical protein